MLGRRCNDRKARSGVFQIERNRQTDRKGGGAGDGGVRGGGLRFIHLTSDRFPTLFFTMTTSPLSRPESVRARRKKAERRAAATARAPSAVNVPPLSSLFLSSSSSSSLRPKPRVSKRHESLKRSAVGADKHRHSEYDRTSSGRLRAKAKTSGGRKSEVNGKGKGSRRGKTRRAPTFRPQTATAAVSKGPALCTERKAGSHKQREHIERSRPVTTRAAARPTLCEAETPGGGGGREWRKR